MFLNMKKEILITTNLELFNKVRNQLDDAEIPYSTKVHTLGSEGYYNGSIMGRKGVAATFENGKLQTTYYVYVKKKYLSLAKFVID